MDKDWISPEEHIAIIKSRAHRNDTLIHLGDVGNPERLSTVKAHKVLIMGNHDVSTAKFRDYFEEIYRGPLFVSEKILLSHEPIYGLSWCMNIHGHDHSACNAGDESHINLAANVCGYQVFDLGRGIKNGLLRNIKGIHRETIDRAAMGS